MLFNGKKHYYFKKIKFSYESNNILFGLIKYNFNGTEKFSNVGQVYNKERYIYFFRTIY